VAEVVTRETTAKEATKVLELTAPVITVESLDILLGTVACKTLTRLHNRLMYLPMKPKTRTQINRMSSLMT
jgi:hypothetical protein